MYGKSYQCKYSGSMFGKGALFFAVWDYVTTNARNGTVEINPKFLAAVLGKCTEDEVQKELDDMCSPDPQSRTKDEEGRRLIREGEYLYRVVNHERYANTRDEDHRREYMRDYMKERREALSGGVECRHAPDRDSAGDNGTSKPVQSRSGDLPAQNIYNAYPRKVARPAALRAIARALTKVGYEKLMELTNQYAAARAGQDPGLTPHPATWFNQERYNDDPSTWKDRELRTGRVTQKDVEQQKRADSLARLAKAQQELHGQGNIQRVG